MKRFGIVFDCDGTLIDSEDQVIEGIHYALVNSGNPDHSTRDIRHHLGPSVDKILLQLMADKSKINKAFNYYLEYQSHHIAETRVYTGIRDLLKTFMKADIPMGIMTGKHSKDLEIALKAHELFDYFPILICDDQLDQSKPQVDGLQIAASQMNLAPQFLYYVGDSVSDIRMAHNIGARSVAALWDKRVDIETMRLEAPTLMIKTPLDLAEYLKI